MKPERAIRLLLETFLLAAIAIHAVWIGVRIERIDKILQMIDVMVVEVGGDKADPEVVAPPEEQKDRRGIYELP